MQIFYILMAVGAGMLLSIQAVINANLALGLGGKAVLASAVSFLIGSVFLLILAKAFHQLDGASIRLVFKQDGWKLIGGVLGSWVVFTTVVTVPKLGVVSMSLLIIGGQLFASFLLDSTGVMGLSKRLITWNKVLGLCFVLLGILLYYSRDIYLHYIQTQS